MNLQTLYFHARWGKNWQHAFIKFISNKYPSVAAMWPEERDKAIPDEVN